MDEARKHQIKFFINKFEATREDEWCTGHAHNEQGQRCALGHVGLTETGHVLHQWDDTASLHPSHLVDLFAGLPHAVAGVNDGLNPHYQQPTPRARVLAALYDLLKA